MHVTDVVLDVQERGIERAQAIDHGTNARADGYTNTRSIVCRNDGVGRAGAGNPRKFARAGGQGRAGHVGRRQGSSGNRQARAVVHRRWTAAGLDGGRHRLTRSRPRCRRRTIAGRSVVRGSRGAVARGGRRGRGGYRPGALSDGRPPGRRLAHGRRCAARRLRRRASATAPAQPSPRSAGASAVRSWSSPAIGRVPTSTCPSRSPNGKAWATATDIWSDAASRWLPPAAGPPPASVAPKSSCRNVMHDERRRRPDLSPRHR